MGEKKKEKYSGHVDDDGTVFVFRGSDEVTISREDWKQFQALLEVLQEMRACALGRPELGLARACPKEAVTTLDAVLAGKSPPTAAEVLLWLDSRCGGSRPLQPIVSQSRMPQGAMWGITLPDGFSKHGPSLRRVAQAAIVYERGLAGKKGGLKE